MTDKNAPIGEQDRPPISELMALYVACSRINWAALAEPWRDDPDHTWGYVMEVRDRFVIARTALAKSRQAEESGDE